MKVSDEYLSEQIWLGSPNSVIECVEEDNIQKGKLLWRCPGGVSPIRRVFVS